MTYKRKTQLYYIIQKVWDNVVSLKKYYYICEMKYLGISLIYLGFFGLIGTAVYITESADCLWALLLTPNLSLKEKEKENGESE